jgi:hypothetical protein
VALPPALIAFVVDGASWKNGKENPDARLDAAPNAE